MPEVSIREAVAEDVPDIQEIAERGWREAYGPFLDDETIDAAMTTWYTPRRIRERVERDGRIFLVAERDESVVGFAGGGPSESSPDAVILGALYVDPDSWRAGIGSRLLDRFEAIAAEQGYSLLRFDVLGANEVGLSFYRDRGFEPVETLESELFGETVTEHVFEGDLG